MLGVGGAWSWALASGLVSVYSQYKDRGGTKTFEEWYLDKYKMPAYSYGS